MSERITRIRLTAPLPPLTMEERRELDIALHSPICETDPDCPPQTPEQLKKFKRVHPRRQEAV